MPSSLKMDTAPSRRSLGRTPLNLNTNLPPSPERVSTNLGTTTTSLNDLIRRQTPRSRNVTVSSPAVPEIEEELTEEGLIGSVPDLVRSRSLDEELVRSGYTPLTKMVVVAPSGKSQVRYVKANNNLGEPVYIAVDVNDAYISQSNNDPRFRESRIPMNINAGEKETAFTQAGMSVSGVAFECKNGLCTIMHDDQLQAPKEQNFILIHTKKHEETFALASFPVVKMSDIRFNPKVVIKNIDLALRKMRNATLQNCLCDINSVQKKFDRTCQLFKETLACKEKIIKEFHRTMTILEDAYDKCSECPEKNLERLKEIVYNIEKRNGKFPALMQSCTEIASLENTLDEANCTLEKAKCKLQKKFKHIHCAYEIKEKKHHHHCAWDAYTSDVDTYSSSDEE